mmetsp:Transcript_54381/g.126907  ORF Transcript_54381/g.126907 Transcript_54381/m.126907 type:complete len:209 (+) Transcript_54381:655-1281(+)
MLDVGMAPEDTIDSAREVTASCTSATASAARLRVASVLRCPCSSTFFTRALSFSASFSAAFAAACVCAAPACPSAILRRFRSRSTTTRSASATAWMDGRQAFPASHAASKAACALLKDRTANDAMLCETPSVVEIRWATIAAEPDELDALAVASRPSLAAGIPKSVETPSKVLRSVCSESACVSSANRTCCSEATDVSAECPCDASDA